MRTFHMSYLAAALRCWRQSNQPLLLTVDGWSMAPLLHSGDQVLVIRCKLDQLRRGDIVLVQNCDGSLLTHRLLRRHSGHVYLIGDAHQHRDQPLPASALLGLVIARVRNGTHLDLRSDYWRLIGLLCTYCQARLRRYIVAIGVLTLFSITLQQPSAAPASALPTDTQGEIV